MFARWGWVPYVGVGVPLFLLVGGALAFTVGDAAAPLDEAVPLAGTLVQVAGEPCALVAGLAVLRARRGRT